MAIWPLFGPRAGALPRWRTCMDTRTLAALARRARRVRRHRARRARRVDREARALQPERKRRATRRHRHVVARHRVHRAARRRRLRERPVGPLDAEEDAAVAAHQGGAAVRRRVERCVPDLGEQPLRAEGGHLGAASRAHESQCARPLDHEIGHDPRGLRSCRSTHGRTVLAGDLLQQRRFPQCDGARSVWRAVLGHLGARCADESRGGSSRGRCRRAREHEGR